MQAFLLDLNHSFTRRYSETAAEAYFLPEPRLDVYDSLDAVTEIEARRHDIGRPQ